MVHVVRIHIFGHGPELSQLGELRFVAHMFVVFTLSEPMDGAIQHCRAWGRPSPVDMLAAREYWQTPNESVHMHGHNFLVLLANIEPKQKITATTVFQHAKNWASQRRSTHYPWNCVGYVDACLKTFTDLEQFGSGR